MVQILPSWNNLKSILRIYGARLAGDLDSNAEKVEFETERGRILLPLGNFSSFKLNYEIADATSVEYGKFFGEYSGSPTLLLKAIVAMASCATVSHGQKLNSEKRNRLARRDIGKFSCCHRALRNKIRMKDIRRLIKNRIRKIQQLYDEPMSKSDRSDNVGARIGFFLGRNFLRYVSFSKNKTLLRKFSTDRLVGVGARKGLVFANRCLRRINFYIPPTLSGKSGNTFYYGMMNFIMKSISAKLRANASDAHLVAIQNHLDVEREEKLSRSEFLLCETQKLRNGIEKMVLLSKCSFENQRSFEFEYRWPRLYQRNNKDSFDKSLTAEFIPAAQHQREQKGHSDEEDDARREPVEGGCDEDIAVDGEDEDGEVMMAELREIGIEALPDDLSDSESDSVDHDLF